MGHQGGWVLVSPMAARSMVERSASNCTVVSGAAVAPPPVSPPPAPPAPPPVVEVEVEVPAFLFLFPFLFLVFPVTVSSGLSYPSSSSSSVGGSSAVLAGKSPVVRLLTASLSFLNAFLFNLLVRRSAHSLSSLLTAAATLPSAIISLILVSVCLGGCVGLAGGGKAAWLRRCTALRAR